MILPVKWVLWSLDIVEINPKWKQIFQQFLCHCGGSALWQEKEASKDPEKIMNVLVTIPEGRWNDVRWQVLIWSRFEALDYEYERWPSFSQYLLIS